MSRPRNISLGLVFSVKGLGKPGLVTLDLSFAVSSPDPTIMFWDGGDLRAAAQRTWTGTDWFPPVV